MDVLEQHYLAQGYTLILNGDIEELLRFSLGEIGARWPDLYALFGRFCDAKLLPPTFQLEYGVSLGTSRVSDFGQLQTIGVGFFNPCDLPHQRAMRTVD